ncbi:sensor histidine kinase [Pseudomonas sp. LS1212]|uniref:sensor histidine kinase n=1 Tax=Pseudomonas sp. LS1212 TaxID=2972478 RepID=UPI00215D5B6D|nr:sensor histidine kinase [Pseudomonas sp. LS1212]UVJ42587.1 sensor histidine kinase [Pseudomonas sp. LS1212]
MYASFKTRKLWPLGRPHVRWLVAMLCIAATLGNLLLYFSASAMPSSLLVLNLAAMLGLGWQYRQSRSSIELRPQELADRLLQVQENERHRLSRELHDDIGQLLTVAKLQADWLQRRVPAVLQEHCASLSGTLDETLANVRDVSAVLNPRQLASLGLEASLRAHLLRTLDKAPVHWSLECHQRLAGIPEEMAVAAFRITQEAVTNMLRHAQAKNLLVRLQRQQEGLLLFISDDGLGFAPAPHPGREGQRGMAGMLERADLLGGTLSVKSLPGKGTQIEALFPWAPRSLERANISRNP